MRNRTILRPAWLLCAAALLALVAAPAARAAEDEGFQLHLDALVFGPQWVDVDSNSAKFQEYTDETDGFKIPKVVISGSDPEGNRELGIWLKDVGQRDARYTLDYDVSGSYSFYLDYNKIPHNYQNDAISLWTRDGDLFEIAAPIRAGLQAALEARYAASPASVNFGFLNGLISPYLDAAPRIDVGLQRDRTHARFEVGKSSNLGWGFEYKHENRTGSRPLGLAFGFNNVTELPEPIDYDTDDATLDGEWRMENGALRFGYRYSRFENNIDTIYWDNPWRATNSTNSGAYQAPSGTSIAGGSRGIASLNPDNTAGSLFANGNWRWGKKFWLNAAFTQTDLRQDADLEPYLLNSAVRTTAGLVASDPGILPQRSADRKVTLTSFNLDFGTRFAEDFTFRARYRFYDYDNKSSQIEIPGYGRYHGYWQNVGRITPKYAWSRDTLSAELGWEIGKASRLGLEYRMDSMDRDFREVKSADDDVLRLTFDSKLAKDWNLRAAAEMGDRSTSEYDYYAEEYSFTEHGVPSQNPDLRRFDEAERDYERFNVTLEWLPANGWSVAAGIDTRQDEYDESILGLTEEEYFNWNVEVGYAPTEKVNFFIHYQQADRDSSMASRQSGATASLNPIDTWYADFEENNDMVGFGFNYKEKRWAYRAWINFSESDGYLDFEATQGGIPLGNRAAAVDIPNYEDISLFQGGMAFDYKIMKDVAVGLFYRYDDYTIDSFILQDLDPYLPGAFLLAGDRGDYEANILGATLKLKF